MNDKYDSFVRSVCGDNWMGSDADERDGGYGVAIVKAFLNGVPPRINDMSNEIRVPPYFLEYAFRRLQNNGFFNGGFSAKNDDDLKDMFYSSGNRDSLIAWCYVAGVSSGFVSKINP